MGSVLSTAPKNTPRSDFVNTYVIEEYDEKRCPVSKSTGLNQWDTIPDKNIQYYSGERFVRYTYQ